jgi:hypothetical protein
MTGRFRPSPRRSVRGVAAKSLARASRFFPFAIMLAFGLLPLDVFGQCCTAGNPVSTGCAVPGDGAHRLSVVWSYLHSSSDAYYRGTRRLEKTYAESRYDFSSLALSYAVSDRLLVMADIGYYFDKAQRFVHSDYTRYARGIADGTIGISYVTHTSDDGLFDISQAARLTIPVGDVRQQYDGVVLPIDFQPSSGNYRYNLGVALNKRFAGSDFSLRSYSSVEFSQAIETERTYHKYGNLYLASVTGAYRISPYLRGQLQLRYEIRDRALNGSRGSGSGIANSYSFLNSSGGVIAYIAPQVYVDVVRGWTFSLQYNYPIHRNIYGEEQLTTGQVVSVSLTRIFDFAAQSHAVDVPSAVPLPGMQTVSLSVGGSCDMCRERIERVAASMPGVLAARWQIDTQTLTLGYEASRPDTGRIARALAGAGHDTSTHAAPDDAYHGLPACCHYR